MDRESRPRAIGGGQVEQQLFELSWGHQPMGDQDRGGRAGQGSALVDFAVSVATNTAPPRREDSRLSCHCC